MENIKIHGLLHRAFSVFLFDSQNRLFLQQRSDEKITFPSCFTNTCCSHPLYTASEMNGVEGAKYAARRKLEHELGIPLDSIDLDQLKFITRIHYLAPSDGIWGEHEIDYIFFYKGNVTLKPNPNEVKSIRYVTQSELKQLFEDAANNKIQMTPWFQLIVETFLYKWWNHIDHIESMQDVQTIHRL